MTKIVYGGKTYGAEAGRDVLGVLLDQRARISYVCMAGACGTCRIRVIKGAEHLKPMEEVEKRYFSYPDGSVRLACQAIVRGTGDIEIAQ